MDKGIVRGWPKQQRGITDEGVVGSVAWARAQGGGCQQHR